MPSEEGEAAVNPQDSGDRLPPAAEVPSTKAVPVRPGVLDENGGPGGLWALKSKIAKLEAEAAPLRARREEEAARLEKARGQLEAAIEQCRELQDAEKKNRARLVKVDRALASNGALLDRL